MYRVTVINNVDRKAVIVDGTTTIREILEMTDLAGVDSVPVISGTTVTNLDATLEELEVSENCTLSLTKRLANA